MIIAVAFNPARDVIFDFGPALKGHANGMVFRILDDDNNALLSETYFSIGGGFVQTEAERAAAVTAGKAEKPSVEVPYPFRTAAEMLEMGRALRPLGRRDEAGQRSGRAEAKASSTPISTPSGPPCATA